jgi:hypothetical protein
MNIPSLEESFLQKPIMTSKLARRKSQAIPMNELQALGLGQYYEEDKEEDKKSPTPSVSSDSQDATSKKYSSHKVICKSSREKDESKLLNSQLHLSKEVSKVSIHVDVSAGELRKRLS